MALICVFSYTYKETRQNPATAPIHIKIIHSLWVLRGFVIRENRKNLIIDWEKMYAIHFDKFILISNLQTTDVSFMPRVAVWISLHAWLIHGFDLCIFLYI